MELQGGCSMNMRYLLHFSDECHFEVIRCNCLKTACNSRTAGRRGKLIEILNPGVVVTRIWGALTLFLISDTLSLCSFFSSADKQSLSQSLYRAGLFVWRPYRAWAMLRV